MNRYLDQMRDNPDIYEDALAGELHVRVSVWPVRSVAAAHPTRHLTRNVSRRPATATC